MSDGGRCTIKLGRQRRRHGILDREIGGGKRMASDGPMELFKKAIAVFVRENEGRRRVNSSFMQVTV